MGAVGAFLRAHNDAMRIGFLLVLSLAPVPIAHTADRAPIAFIGTFVESRRVDCGSSDTDSQTGEIIKEVCLRSPHAFAFDVEKSLEGNLSIGERIRFHGPDHYDPPDLALKRRAMVYVARYEDGYRQIEKEWDPVYATSDGEFARCGCDYDVLEEVSELDSDWAPNCRDISFSPPVTVDLTHHSDYVLARYRASRDYRVRERLATCVRGVLAEDIYKVRRPELIGMLKKYDKEGGE